MLSKSAEYAVRAVHFLAFVPGEDPVPTARLAERVGAPENYLSKLLHRLQKEGVVTSRRGRGGGFTLARPRERVTLAEVVEPFDDVLERRCLLGRSKCRDRSPCAAHEQWREVAARVRDFFRNTTLESVGPPVGEGAGPDPDRRPVPAASTEAASGGRETG